MSDDDFDDPFFTDDTFLKEIDSLTATAATTAALRPTVSTGSTAEPYWRPLRKPGWTGSRPVAASSSMSGLPGANAPPAAAQAKVSRIAFPPLGDRPQPTISGEKRASSPQTKRSTNSAFSRSTSSNQLQTHLNFRRDVQYTKGKRWDRTAFAESGRRIDAERRKGAKGKGKGKGKSKASAKRDDEDEDDEMPEDEEDEEEEEDDVDEAWSKVVPGPKPFVDPSKPYDPQKHIPISAVVDTYLYPINHPKRDYQYEIVQACFKDNCLVALPTGLGKTFVAGVVMLNFYRWFPKGKIVFLAPTRPLVQQQIEACQLTCGIPSKEAAVITGQSLPVKKRAAMWESRRVFYCTPQCFEVDLKRGHVDPKDIVLVVFDEAHKASGSYSYTTILAYLTAHTPFFRVLALTATPGSDVERVQAVVDALHISRIEIREAEAPDIRKYMNEKKSERHIIPPSSMIESFRDRWAVLMTPYIQKLVKVDILNDRALDAKRLRPYSITAKRMELARNGKGKGQQWAYGSLAMLEKMSRAMSHLLEFSLGMFHTNLSEIAGNVTTEGKNSKTKAGSNQVSKNFEFQRLLRDVEQETNSIRLGLKGRNKTDRHPKMGKTLELLLAYFTQAEEEERTLGEPNNTRAMVFCSFRECVLEVVEMLNDQSPTLRATKFVGQSAGKKAGDKGFNQKEQKKTIAEFKEGKYNVLVATSIGEEGLDIGEVDFVVLYDMPKTSIKLLQRVGRTGRKRSGIVHALMSENREDMNWDAAQQTHREIQEEILHSRNLELFEDVEPLLPKGPFPQCVEQVMDIDPFDPDEGKQGRQQPLQTYREREAEFRKEKEAFKQRGHEIPENAVMGFASVKDLMIQAGKKIGTGRRKSASATAKAAPRGRKTKGVDRVLSASESDEDVADRPLFDLIGPKKRSTASSRGKVAATDEPPAKQSKASGGGSRKKGAKQIVPVVESASESEAELGVLPPRASDGKLISRPFPMTIESEAIDFLHTQGPVRNRDSPLKRVDSPPASPGSPYDLVPPATGTSRSRVNPEHPPPLTRDESLQTDNLLTPVQPVIQQTLKQVALTPRTAEAAGFSHLELADLGWSSDVAPTPDIQRTKANRPADSQVKKGALARRRALGLSRPSQASAAASPLPALVHTKSANQMPPPPPPVSSVRSSPLVPADLDTQYPVQRVGKRPTRMESSLDTPDTGRPIEESSPIEQLRRIRRRVESSSPAATVEGAEPLDRAERIKHARRYVDMDVGVSGSESPDEGFSDHSTHSDRIFAGHFEPTQAPKGYNQRAAYLAGLSTQAASAGGPAFPNLQAKRDAFFAKARKPLLLSSDVEDGGSENEYELGSFVIEDDADLGFQSQSQV